MRRTCWTVLVALCGASAACGESVDPAGLPSIEGYETWDRVEFSNDVPGHSDSYRKIYINPVARAYAGGRYSIGSVLVKEVFEKTDDGQPADLRYIAVMRKVEDPYDHVEDPAEEVDAPVDGGWVFTQIKGGSEESHDLCWGQCHKQAPYDGAWFDYGF